MTSKKTVKKRTQPTTIDAEFNEPLNRRLNIRVSRDEHAMLVELRDVLQAATDSAAIRTLIRLHYRTMHTERARLRRARRARG